MIASIHVEVLKNGYFPDSKKDKISLICTSFYKFENEKYIHISNSVLKLEDSDKFIILDWIKIIKEMKVSLIIGWYIFGFDYIFLQNRAKKLGVKEFEEIGIIPNDYLKYYIESNISKFDLMYYLNSKKVLGNLFKILEKYEITAPSYNNDLTKYALDCCSSYFKLYEKLNKIYNIGL